MDLDELEGLNKGGKGDNNDNDLITRIILILSLALLAILVIVTFLSGIYAAVSHPGDTLLNIIYGAVVYTSPYILYAGLGLALYILRKSLTITITFSTGVLVLILLWIFKNIIYTEEDVSLGYSLYDTLHSTFNLSAMVAGGFAFVLLMLAYLMIPDEYH